MLTTQHCKRLETAAPCQSTVQEQEEEEEGLRREMRAESAAQRGGEAMLDWGSAATERGPKMGCGPCDY